MLLTSEATAAVSQARQPAWLASLEAQGAPPRLGGAAWDGQPGRGSLGRAAWEAQPGMGSLGGATLRARSR